MFSRFTGRLVALSSAMAVASCGSNRETVKTATAELETVAAIVTEVAQSTDFGGAVADKVEVYCTNTNGCPAFRVCDTSPSGSSCSALQPAMTGQQRVVVSRGANITATDQVWLVDSDAVERAGTRVGPFACAAGTSQSRIDCSIGAFGACAAHTLGASVGSCTAGDFPEPFTFNLQFTQNQHGRPESSCNRPVCQTLLSALNSAQYSVEFALYGVRSQPAIIDALGAAQNRGVSVRGVVDSESADCTVFGYPDTPALIQALGPGNVVCDVGAGYSYIMHNKFFVIDGTRVWTGSTNVSDTETGGEYNSDVAALIESYRLAEIYTAEFNEMHAGLFHHRKADNTAHVIDSTHYTDGTVVRSYFSPTDHAVANAVLPIIQQASQTLDVAMFFLTSQPIADSLVQAKQRGVAVRLVLDAGGASNSYSKHGQLCNAGIAVKVENWGGKSHSKWVVADAAQPNSAAVVFGSMNFTASGDEQNDENTLYVKNGAFASAFQSEFNRQWSDLTAVPSCTSVSVEGTDSSTCSPRNNCGASCSSGSCCDGLDNDYDGKLDLAEEACACGDGIDNDGDGYIDFDDYDCKNLPDP